MTNDILEAATQITAAWIQSNPRERPPRAEEVVGVFNAVYDAVRGKATGR